LPDAVEHVRSHLRRALPATINNLQQVYTEDESGRQINAQEDGWIAKKKSAEQNIKAPSSNIS
jgi:hypothetical protein